MSEEPTTPDPAALVRLQIDAVNRHDFDAMLPYAAAAQRTGVLGAPVQTREAHVTEWKDGMGVRTTVYIDIDEARAAAERLAGDRR